MNDRHNNNRHNNGHDSRHDNRHNNGHNNGHNKNSNRNNHERDPNVPMDLCVDSLFPSHVRSGTRGKKLDVESLFSNTPLNNEPDITFSSNIILARREKRRKEKLNCYRHMLKYCHTRITDADEDQESDIVFTVIDAVPECKEYDPLECLEFISVKLREEDFDTTILTTTTMFITWKYLELKKKDKQDKQGKQEKQNKQNKQDKDEKKGVKEVFTVGTPLNDDPFYNKDKNEGDDEGDDDENERDDDEEN